MLSCPCFSNDPPSPHFLGKESLAESIVDLVGTAMQEVLSLQVDSSPSNMPSQIGSKIERCWSSSESVQPARQLFLEGGVVREPVVRFLKCSQRLHQSLRDILPAVFSELARLRTCPWFGALLQALTSFLTFPSMSDDFIIDVPSRIIVSSPTLDNLLLKISEIKTTALAPAFRPAWSCFGDTTMSFIIVGTCTSLLIVTRVSKLPSKFSGSVRTESAHAPPLNIAFAIKSGFPGSLIFPAEGEAYFISVMIGVFLFSWIVLTRLLRDAFTLPLVS